MTKISLKTEGFAKLSNEKYTILISIIRLYIIEVMTFNFLW
jgi:hypothetical protein